MIVTKQLKRSFMNGDVVTHVLKGIDFSVERGEFVSIVGRSGAGKSTFMYQMSLLDRPTSGTVLIDAVDADELSEVARARMRLLKFGYVFQDYALLPELTALENVALPLLMQGKSRVAAYREATKALKRMELDHRLGNLPSQLSGGEQQRVSIARSVAHNPEVLFADEPTANLDSESSAGVMAIFKELHKGGQTIIMVTHEPDYAKLAERVVTIDDGQIVGEVETRHKH